MKNQDLTPLFYVPRDPNGTSGNCRKRSHFPYTHGNAFVRRCRRDAFQSGFYWIRNGGASLMMDSRERPISSCKLPIRNKSPLRLGWKKRNVHRPTIQRIQCDYGIVIGDGKLAHFSEDKIICLPLSYFLLM